MNEKDLGKMKLPKANLVRQRSTQMQSKLLIAILESVAKIEAENKYKFEQYEIDFVLLEIIHNHHENYLSKKFGYKII